MLGDDIDCAVGKGPQLMGGVFRSGDGGSEALQCLYTRSPDILEAFWRLEECPGNGFREHRRWLEFWTVGVFYVFALRGVSTWAEPRALPHCPSEVCERYK